MIGDDTDGSGCGDLPDALCRAIVDRTTHPFVVLDVDGVITYVSGTVQAISGWDPRDLVGRSMLEFLPVTELQKAADAFVELQHAAAEVESVPIVFEVLTPDGGSIWADVGALRIPDFDGAVLRLRSWTHNHHFDLFLNALLGSRPFPEVAEHLCRSISLALHSAGALLHHGFDGFEFVGTDGAGVPLACAPFDCGPWHRAVLTEEPVYASVEDLPPRARLAAEEPGFQAIWCVPITMDRLPPAALTVWRTEPGPPLLGLKSGLVTQSRYAQLAIQRWAEHQRLVHIAGHDSLTGVANRSSFRDRLAQALAIGEQNLAVAFCDLDAFKPVNDTYGHPTGDQVLVQVADRLRRSLRAGDELARVGGDEFTVLMRNVPDATAAQHLAERLLASTAEPFDANGHPVELGISVGVALVRWPSSADTLLALADAALYEAKQAGGNQACVSQA
jgi:diguanylate cyclase (GGDEF)-like protein/PAS domain S-box-containing protein